MLNRNFTPFPTLTTERLTLRPLSRDDQHDVLALRSDPEVNQYIDRLPCETTEDALNFINKVNDRIEKNLGLYWAITLTDNQIFAGSICLFDFSEDKNSCELGYELMRKSQGQGIMKEAVQIVLQYAFQTLKLDNIFAFTHRENHNSIKLLLKLHFIESKERDKENADLTIFMLAQ